MYILLEEVSKNTDAKSPIFGCRWNAMRTECICDEHVYIGEYSELRIVMITALVLGFGWEEEEYMSYEEPIMTGCLKVYK